MTKTTISPFVVSDVSPVVLAAADGTKKKYWKKQILPAGVRTYKGQTLDFAKINPSIVKAWEEGARDSIPFVLALPDNKHPERGQELETLEGDLEKMELAKDGSLYGYFDLSNSPKVQDLIAKSNGKLGVSGRIEVDYEREDVGKKWDYALSHVCGTTGAHIKGMKPWESVELSEDEKKSEVTIDFSTEVIDSPAKQQNETGSGETVSVDISKEDFDKLMGFIGQINKGEEIANNLPKESEEGAPAELSEEAQKRIDLAESNARKAYEFAEKAMADAAERDWNVSKRELAREGVPPVILDFAEPVMKLHKRPVLKLSENEEVDARKVIEEILDACKGVVKLNEETGHGLGSSVIPASDKEYADFESYFLGTGSLNGNQK